jgi:cytochrome c biogenesis protein CcmG/thiol:disulfide interchange protein DsbE
VSLGRVPKSRSPFQLIGLGLVALLAAIAIIVVAKVPLGSTAVEPDGTPIIVGGSPLLGKPAPAIDLVALDGSHVRLSDYLGRPVIVNFWASWCGPCRDEFPQFVTARRDHAAEGLEVLGVIHDDNAQAAADFAASEKAGWPMLMDAGDAIWNAYIVPVGVPATFFIDRAGIVRATSFGPVTPTGLPQQLGTILG